MNNWKELEEFVKGLLKADNAVIPKNSGGTKSEEDVIGNTTIAQCKFTENKNISILSKDLERLLRACELQDKFPLFITGNPDSTILSIPLLKDNIRHINYVLEVIVSLVLIEKVKVLYSEVDNLNDFKEIKKWKTKAISLINRLITDLRQHLNECETKESIKYNKLVNHDLFEGVN